MTIVRFAVSSCLVQRDSLLFSKSSTKISWYSMKCARSCQPAWPARSARLLLHVRKQDGQFGRFADLVVDPDISRGGASTPHHPTTPTTPREGKHDPTSTTSRRPDLRHPPRCAVANVPTWNDMLSPHIYWESSCDFLKLRCDANWEFGDSFYPDPHPLKVFGVLAFLKQSRVHYFLLCVKPHLMVMFHTHTLSLREKES